MMLANLLPDTEIRLLLCKAVPRFWTTSPGQSVVAPVAGGVYAARKPALHSQWWHFWKAGENGASAPALLGITPAFLVGERYVAASFEDVPAVAEAEPEEAAPAAQETAQTMAHSALASLQKFLDAQPKETIGGVRVEDAAKMVELDIAFSPVLVEAHYEPSDSIPRPCQVSLTEDGKYIVYAPSGPQIVDAETLQTMRARFLLWNDYLYKLVAKGQLFPHPKRDQYVAWYHGGSLHIPQILIDHYQRQTEEAA